MVTKSHYETSTPYLWDQTLWTPSFSPDDPELLINQDVADCISSTWVQVVMASTEEECVELFEKMKNDLHAMGLDDLVAFQQAALDKNKAKLEGK